jgi:hypothetical protein
MNGLILRVHNPRFLFLTAILLLISVLAFAQEGAPRRGSKIIDDTTKSIYGPKTSRYFFEEDVFLNQQTFHLVDTTIRNFHYFTDVQRLDNRYQDLGNIGTAMQSIYYKAPDVIGKSSGFHAYDVHWNNEQVRYWDTKSTYSNMRIELGGFGRSRTKASYSRNINPRWNFGFTYRGILADRQFDRQEGKGDRNVRSVYYDLFTTYMSKDSAYRVFFNFRRQYHRVNEQGGVRSDVPTTFTYEDFFQPEANRKLQEAQTSELKTNFHIFHQYALGNGLQVYHILDKTRQGNRYTDQPKSEADVYFDYREFVGTAADTSEDRTLFKSLRNEAGIKGSLSKLFYNGYFALRNYSMKYQYDTLLNNVSHDSYSGYESYVGGRIALRLDSLVTIGGWGEVLLENQNYRIEGNIRSKWFDATLRQMQYDPSFLSQYYRGSQDYWMRSFSPTNSTELSGNLHYRSESFSISPGINLSRIGNYLYYKSATVPEDRIGEYSAFNPDSVDVLPFQTSSDIILASPQVRLELRMLKHIYFRGLAIYTTKLDDPDNAISIPELFANAQLSYENIFFNDNFDMHGGVDVHWHSAYYAMAYDVPTQQFYIQGEKINTPFLTNRSEVSGYEVPGSPLPPGPRFQSPAFPVIDLFLSARIKRGRVFFRYNNLLHQLTGKGYFPTPTYPGLRSLIDFGFDWSFYD